MKGSKGQGRNAIDMVRSTSQVGLSDLCDGKRTSGQLDIAGILLLSREGIDSNDGTRSRSRRELEKGKERGMSSSSANSVVRASS